MTKTEQTTTPENMKDSQTLKLPDNQKPQEPVQQPANNAIYDINGMTDDQKTQKAKEWGHIPKEDFRGDQSKWTDPDTFLRVSQEKMPALRNQVKKQDAVIDTQKMIIENMQRAFDDRKASLVGEKREASDDVDMVKFSNLEREERNIDQQQIDLKNNLSQLNDSQIEDKSDDRQIETEYAVNNWVQQNPWYKNPQNKEDYANQAFATQKMNQYEKAYPGAKTEHIMQMVSKDIGQFNQPANNSSNYSPAGIGGTPSISQNKTEADLTADGQRNLNRYLKLASSDAQKEAYKKSFMEYAGRDENFNWHKK